MTLKTYIIVFIVFMGTADLDATWGNGFLKPDQRLFDPEGLCLLLNAEATDRKKKKYESLFLRSGGRIV